MPLVPTPPEPPVTPEELAGAWELYRHHAAGSPYLVDNPEKWSVTQRLYWIRAYRRKMDNADA